MQSSPELLFSVLRHRRGAMFSATLAICCAIGGQVAAQVPYDDQNTSEGWAWARIKQGNPADLNVRCFTPPLDPRAANEPGWTNSCRQLSATFLIDVLTRAPWRDQVPFSGVTIIGARIVGNIDLRHTKINRRLAIERSRIENAIVLYAARTDSDIGFIGSRVTGTFDAGQLHAEMSLILADSEFKQWASLNHAKIDGFVTMDGATFDGYLNADASRVGASLFMRSTEQSRASFKEVNLNSARIAGNVEMDGAAFDGYLDANALQVGASLFMRSTERNKVSFKEVNLNSARVGGSVEMDGATFDGYVDADALQVGASLFMRSTERDKVRFKGVNLNSATVTGNLDMNGATFEGDLIADLMQVGATLWMRSTAQSKASFKGVSLNGARVTGDVDMGGANFNAVSLYSAKVAGSVLMDGATFDGGLSADLLQVGASLWMRGRFKEVSLNSARVTGFVVMDGATFDGNLVADSLQVGAALWMRSTDQSKASFKEVNLVGARVAGNVEMDGVTFDGELNIATLQVGASLYMRSTAQSKVSFKAVNLVGTKVTGNVDMDGAAFGEYVNADSLQVGADLFMRDIMGAQSIIMVFARIGGNVDIRGSTFAELNLSGASIGGELRLGTWSKTPTLWRTNEGEPGNLILGNTRVANLVDAENVWPLEGHLRLEGFSFGRLGGFDVDIGHDMRRRPMSWWDSWARRDPAYSPAPYGQLAAALVAAGDRDAADEIRFLGRVRERETETNWWPWIFSGILQYGAGFGIGDYTFRVLYWVIGISVAGAVYLWTCVPAAQTRGRVWCLGASLARLLPVIEVNKEFTEFFNDPDRKRLTGWQSFVFSLVGLVGWVLGLILLAAISGLTQKQ